ncbi:MAG: serine--tRNA ligase [Candidatus Diapherotrites archaeon]|uniref:Serine--tRNA ligase n=1 Tax=Candidatus Iainarchaeum sp. TaxID=3101447 RepID=A0A8T5GEB3_9ARCH|nr:serine--tRNA ligase [Candidatus Diapherotrites archaeon]
MLDAKYLREEFDEIKKNLKMRKDDDVISRLDSWKKKDDEWRALKLELDALKKQRNEITQKIKIAKSKGEDTNKLLEQAKLIPKKIKEDEPKVRQLEEELRALQLRIPNVLHDSVPYGESDEENVEEKKWGKVKENKNLIHHAELVTKLGLAEFERAVKISGTGFFYLKGELALLDLALQRLAIDMLIKKGFTPIQPPLLMNRKAYEGVTDLGDFETVMYKIENDDLYLIATSEHPMVSMYMGEILDEEELNEPIKFAGMSPCFRREIGKHGLDERGLFRVHQFNKIEQVVVCKPEESWNLFEQMSKNQQEYMEALEIPYRIVNVCTGDIGIVAAKKFDLEGWSPREGKYIELGSCSNCTAYQAVRLNIKYRKKNGDKEFVHTLNNTMVPTTRTLRVLIENYQTANGTIKIPKALQPYMNGLKEIKGEKK